MTMYGANADELDRVAKAMINAADDLENDTGFLSRLIQSVPWVGGVAKAFISTWESNHARRLNQSVQFLRLTADGLSKNAAQQRDASNDTGGLSGGTTGAGGGTSTAPPRPDTRRADAAKLAEDLKNAFQRTPYWWRNHTMAKLMAKAVETMGAERVTMAVAALAASGKAGQAVIASAMRGTRLLPPAKAQAVRDVIGSGQALARPQPRPLPAPWRGIGRLIRPQVIHIVRQFQSAVAVFVPWNTSFVFDQCYPVNWNGVNVRVGR